MSNQTLLLLVLMFIIKHFIIDFLCQNKWQYANKHILGHPGGLFHAWLHAIITVLILDHFRLLSPIYLLYVGFAEWIIHYFVDYTKMNVQIKYNLKPDNSELFWYLLGFDQLLHYITYVGIIWYTLTI